MTRTIWVLALRAPLRGAQFRSRRIGHRCVLDGVFEGGPGGQFQFRPAHALTPEALAAVAALRIAGDDRAGLECLLRYCARLAFALERLTQVNPDRVVYRLPKLQPDGRTVLSPSPWNCFSASPRLSRRRAVIATVTTGCWRPTPHSPLRAAVTAFGHDTTISGAPAQARTPAGSGARPVRYHWAILLARLFAAFPLLCPQCGAELRLIAFVTAAEPVARILTHLGEPAEPPRIALASGPPAWDGLLEPLPDWDALAQTAPEFEFDQRISW